MNRPTQPDMNDPVWTDTPLSIQQWMDDADAYITAIEQERDEAVTLLRLVWDAASFTNDEFGVQAEKVDAFLARIEGEDNDHGE